MTAISPNLISRTMLLHGCTLKAVIICTIVYFIFSFKYVKGDNQTICGYSQLQGQTICVSVCTGDFCNGPSTAANTIASAVAIAIMAVGALTLTHW